jgi:hypothetical protein
MAFTQTNITLDDTMMGPYTVDTITLDSININHTPYTISSTIAPGSVLTNSGWTPTPTLTVSQSGTIQLEGENADIRVNGESMMQTLRNIQDRLNMLRPNPELEAEWDQLRALGEQYRKLESEFKEKSKMWNTLKK